MKKIIGLISLILAALMLAGCLVSCKNISVEDINKTLDALDSILNELDDTSAAGGSSAGTQSPDTAVSSETASAGDEKPDKNGIYTSKEDVAAYIIAYGELPSNFVTKEEAKNLGWSGSGSDALDNYPALKNKCIGGDYFGNYENKLPKKSGRSYTECDIDTLNAKQRGVKRIVFSNDGLIYYTEDHYETFTLLYGEP